MKFLILMKKNAVNSTSGINVDQFNNNFLITIEQCKQPVKRALKIFTIQSAPNAANVFS